MDNNPQSFFEPTSSAENNPQPFNNPNPLAISANEQMGPSAPTVPAINIGDLYPPVPSSEHPKSSHAHASPPPPPQHSQSPQPSFSQDSLIPQPVVRVLSPFGVEYVFFTIALLTTAFGLGSVIISLINGESSFSVLSYPAALLIVSLPVFAFLFLRLKKIELQNVNQKFDASKRRSTQFLQIMNFIVCFFTTIGLVGGIFSKLAGEYSGSILKLILDVLVVLVISGGILFYFWREEHTKRV